MTDEKLDQILQQALTPEIKDEDIRINKRVRKMTMKNYFKVGMAVAACAALLVVANIGEGLLQKTDASSSQFDEVAENESDGKGNIMEKIADSFVITCHAEELQPGVQVPVSVEGNSNKYGYGLSGTEGDDGVTYYVGANFLCQGENISSITYSINKGAFCITEYKGKSIIKDCVPYTGNELSVGMGFADDELEPGQTEADRKTEDRFVTSFTVDYAKQDADTTIISICGVKKSERIYKAVFEAKSLEEEMAGFTELFKDTEVSCTVNYADGKSGTKSIMIKGCKEESEGYISAGFAYEMK